MPEILINLVTVFTPINALGVYKKNSILGWAFIGEGRLFKEIKFCSRKFFFSLLYNLYLIYIS